jgi:hypothetical protein
MLQKEFTLANAAGHYALLHCSPMQPKLKHLHLHYKNEFFATYESRKMFCNNLKCKMIIAKHIVCCECRKTWGIMNINGSSRKFT